MHGMKRLTRRKGWSWLGILLVLAQLWAPTVSHALRAADAAALPLSLEDLCSSLHGGAVPGAAAFDADGRDAALPDPVCGYCLQAGATAPPSCLPSAGLPPRPTAAPDPDRDGGWCGRPPLRHDAARAPPASDVGTPRRQVTH